jgi:thiosulfate/3-mercaptopyruvate sulfurtransferase
MSVPALVSTDWLAAHLGDADVRVADVRWSLLDRDKGRAAYARVHVPGAVFLDVDTDLASLPGQRGGRHPLPRPDAFAASMARAGVGPDTHVVAYDFGDGSTAARLWFLLRYFGHVRASVLDGGMARWEAEGRALEAGAPPPPRPAEPFVAVPHPDMVVDADAVERLRTDPRALVIDSRAAERYEGKVEPVDPVAGHVPGAKSRPYATNVRAADDPRLLPPDALRDAFLRLGADRAESVVCYCGSGVNACQNLLALEVAGIPGARLYAGSWSDWCSVPGRPVATGPS